MKEVVSDTEKRLLIQYLSKHIEKNIYLYIDLIEYGVNDPNIKVWVDENSTYQIVLKYYNSFQLYFSDAHNGDYGGVIGLILEYQPSMVSGSLECINDLCKFLQVDYNIDNGYVLKQSKIDLPIISPTPQRAIIDDLYNIAELICSDRAIGGHYTIEDLKSQLSDRIESGFGRNYIITSDDKVVAHYGTYAEIEELAVMGGLIVHPEYRGKGYGNILHSYLSNVLIAEGKTPYLFCHEDYVLKMYLKSGAELVGEYGKLTRKNI